ncbi:MAG: hypothetical protein AAGI71_17245 [Bacteroidota bacterium]
MNAPIRLSLLLVLLIGACAQPEQSTPTLQGQFNKAQDLYLAHFDVKTDVDDVHAVAAVATMLADSRLEGVRYHAVAGAYGTQGGLYVPANPVFERAFGDRWSDAHADVDEALREVAALATETLRGGGRLWIADGGQSDFSAALVRQLQADLPEADLKDRVHIVQHADWNEEVTTPEDLAFVKEVTSYHRLPDGNTTGNGSPNFRSEQAVDWQRHITDPQLVATWEAAIEVADTYNGVEDRYLNEAIMQGGLDFSDTSETTWIFGFNDLVDAEDFFQTFATTAP